MIFVMVLSECPAPVCPNLDKTAKVSKSLLAVAAHGAPNRVRANTPPITTPVS
jgi:hypothetical protein